MLNSVWFHRWKRRFYGLPTRILSVFIIQAVVTFVLLVFLGNALLTDRNPPRFPQLLEDYLERLIADFPPHIHSKNLLGLQHKTGLRFALQRHGRWVNFSDAGVQQDAMRWKRDWKGFRHHPNWRWQIRHGQVLARLVLAADDVLWVQFRLREKPPNRLGLYAALAIIFVMLILTYLWVRKLLRPIGQIQAGVEHYAQGDFSHRVTVHGKSDLAELSRTINDMAAAIEQRLQKEHQLFMAMSHELRTPLARLRVAIEMLKDPDLKQIMLRSLASMESIIDTLLLREKLEQQGPALEGIQEPIELKPFVERLMAQHFADRSPQQVVKVDIPPGLTVRTDAFALELILKNLIANALKYGLGKPITVGVTPPEKKSPSLEIWVEDQGIGLNEAEQKQLFEPFFRADQARSRDSGGLGLGLYLSQALAKHLQGQLRVHSTPAQGSRFTLTLSG